MRRYIINEWDGLRPAPVLATNDYNTFKSKANELVKAGKIVHGMNRLVRHHDTTVLSYCTNSTYAYEAWSDTCTKGDLCV